jgi:phytoene desaturase
VHFARGGTAAIVEGLVRLLNEQGTEVQLNSPVAEIVVDNGRTTGVRTDAGFYHPADLVVSNADPTVVYERMVAPTHRRRVSDRALHRKKQSMSLFVAYFGTRKQYPDVAHHSILLGPRYRELLRDIFDRKVLADDFSLYLHMPTRSDPSLAPPGHEAMYVLSPVPNNRSGIDWADAAQPYFDRIVSVLEERLLPGLRENLVSPSFLTPHDFEHTLRSADGAAFGREPILTQSAYFRYHNKSPDVEGLYFVGAGTHPGGGVPGVLCSAKVLERLITLEKPSREVPAATG